MDDIAERPHQTASFCRLCPAVCGVLVTASDGQIVRIRGDETHPVSKGYTCTKGRRTETHNGAGRLLEPQIRRGEGLVGVSWTDLFDDLAPQLAHLRQVDPDSIALYVGTAANFDIAGLTIARRWFQEIQSRSLYTTSTVDSVAKLLVPELMAGKAGLRPVIDLDATTLAVYVGQNPVVSHGAYSYMPDPVRILRGIKARGELWVIDPRRTETAALADYHLAPRVGTDYAIFAHLIRELLIDGAEREYLAEHALGADVLRLAVDRFDRASTGSITAVAEDSLSLLLHSIRRHKTFAVVTGTGVTMAGSGTVTEWLTYCLQIITRSYERPGGRWFNPGYLSKSPSAPLPVASGIAESGPRSRPELPRRFDQYPCAALVDEIESGNVRALLVLGGNPLIALPQPNRLRLAFDKLDVLAIWDTARNDMLRHATHVLPSPACYERADLMISSVLPELVAQYAPAVLTPPGSIWPMWRSIAHLHDRMSESEDATPLLPGGLGPDECTDDDILREVADSGRGTWEELSATRGAISYTRDDQWVERHQLPNGRWQLAPAPFVELLAALSDRGSAPLVLTNRREVNHSNSVYADAGEPARVYLHPDDARAAAIIDGGPIQVRSAQGTVDGTACYDARLSPGTVAIPHGHASLDLGNLTSHNHVDPLTGMVEQVGVPLAIRTGPERSWWPS